MARVKHVEWMGKSRVVGTDAYWVYFTRKVYGHAGLPTMGIVFHGTDELDVWKQGEVWAKERAVKKVASGKS